MTNQGALYRLVTMLLRMALVLSLFLAGWLVYSRLPRPANPRAESEEQQTTLQIILQTPTSSPLEIPVELYPIDIVAVRHEYFTERREGKRFDDFLNERMRGRKPIAATLDKDGQATVLVPQGSWWIHALVSGEESFEWRLHINVVGRKLSVALTPQNAYTRAKSF